MYSDSLTLEQENTLHKLRKRLSALSILDEDLLQSDNFLLRSLILNRFRLEKALDTIVDYCECRKLYDPESLLNETFPQKFADTFAIYQGGEDYNGRPIALIPDIRSWRLKDAIQSGNEQMFERYMMKWTLAFEKLVLERDVDYGILVVDANGSARTAFANAIHKRSVELAIRLFTVAQKTAPGVFGKIYVVNAPKLLVTLFNYAKNMVNITADLQFIHSPDTQSWQKELREYVPEDGISPHFGGTCLDFEQVI